MWVINSLVVALLIIIARDRYQLARQIVEPGRRSKLTEISYLILPFGLLVVFIHSFIFASFKIPSMSMMPKIMPGDHIISTKYDYNLQLPLFNIPIMTTGRPGRGDIVLFRYPQDPRHIFIKRVVGLPGDTIHYIDKLLYVNDVLVTDDSPGQFYSYKNVDVRSVDRIRREKIGAKTYKTLIASTLGSANIAETVPDGHYFVIGDNRDFSSDSRSWSAVPHELLVGKPRFVLFSGETLMNKRFGIPIN